MNHSNTFEVKTNYGKLHITIVKDKKNNIENIFAEIGKSGTNIKGFIEGICRLINLAIRNKINLKEIYKELEGISSKEKPLFDGKVFKSIPDTFAYILKKYEDST